MLPGLYFFRFFGFSLRIESRSCRCFATGSGEWVDADPAACDREEDLDELIETVETVDTTEMEIKDEEVFHRFGGVDFVFMERFSQKKT